MRTAIRLLMHWFYRPFLRRYLLKGRSFRRGGLRLAIPAGVFHPAFFGSTKVMARFLERQELKGRSLLEIGCGSGLLSLVAARRGAEVTALDINAKAVACCRDNAARNSLALLTIKSDLFDSLPARPYDIIISNPPYFEGEPGSAAAAAWYCGEAFGFFRRLFARLPEYSHPGSRVWLILSASCRLESIGTIAGQYHYGLDPVYEEARLFEDFIVFEAKPIVAKHKIRQRNFTPFAKDDCHGPGGISSCQRQPPLC